MTYHHFIPASHLRRWACFKGKGKYVEVLNLVSKSKEFHSNNVTQILGRDGLYNIDGLTGHENKLEENLFGPIDSEMNFIYNRLSKLNYFPVSYKNAFIKSYVLSIFRHPVVIAESSPELLRMMETSADEGDEIDMSDVEGFLSPQLIQRVRHDWKFFKANIVQFNLAVMCKKKSFREKFIRNDFTIYHSSELDNTFITGDAFAAKLKHKTGYDKRILTCIPVSPRACVIMRGSKKYSFKGFPGESIVDCVNDAILKKSTDRVVFLGRPKVLMDLGVKPGQSVTRRFGAMWPSQVAV